MKAETINQARDSLLPNSVIAIKRAALRAREVAFNTNTAIIIVKNGKLVRVYPKQDSKI